MSGVAGNAADSFSPPYSGPFRVIFNKRDIVFDVYIGDRVESLSVDRLKAHRISA
jgi:hypothetical protein